MNDGADSAPRVVHANQLGHDVGPEIAQAVRGESDAPFQE